MDIGWTNGVSAWLVWPFGALVAATGLIVVIVVGVWLIGRRKPSRGGLPHHAVGVVGAVGDIGGHEAPAHAAQSSSLNLLRNGKDIVEDIATAEKRGDTTALAALYLEHARFLLDTGSPGTASETLRKSVTLAAKHDLKKIHADARLELASLAEDSGDMTTACEHWQIARTLFHELRLEDDVVSTDQRMLGNGCPTDWVLTDF